MRRSVNDVLNRYKRRRKMAGAKAQVVNLSDAEKQGLEKLIKQR
jgi:hypothetical protein